MEAKSNLAGRKGAMGAYERMPDFYQYMKNPNADTNDWDWTRHLRAVHRASRWGDVRGFLPWSFLDIGSNVELCLNDKLE